MRLLRRNTTHVLYRAFTGKTERLSDGLHTGEPAPQYGAPVEYRGTMSVANGHVAPELFGQKTNYTHVLLLDKPDADIREAGLIEWKGHEYEITAVRPSLNVLNVALRKRTV